MAEESSGFNQQYESILALLKDTADSNSKDENLVIDAKKNYQRTDNTSTDYLKGIAKQNKEYYDGGGSLNPSFREVAMQVPKDIFNKLKKISKIESKTPKDKNNKARLYARLETWKRERLADKANVKVLVDAVSSDLVNYELMNPELKMLQGQLISRDEDLSEKGIKLFNRKSDDKLMVEYTGNRMDTEYASSMTKQDGVDRSKNNALGQTLGASAPQTRSISFEQVMGGIHHKQLDAETKIYETVTGQAEEASRTTKNTDVFQVANWSGGINSGESKVIKALTPVIKGQMVIADLATRDIFGKGSTYRDDLEGLVGGMDLSKLGIIDKGKPGYEDDLANNALLKEEIIRRLILPQNSVDQKFAEESMVEYFTLLAGQSFNNKRDEIIQHSTVRTNKAVGDLTVSGMTPEEIIKKFS